MNEQRCDGCGEPKDNLMDIGHEIEWCRKCINEYFDDLEEKDRIRDGSK